MMSRNRLSVDERLRRGLLGLFTLGMALSITLSEIALGCLAARLAFRVVTGRARVGGWPLALPVLAWTIASLLAALVSAHPLQSAESALRGLWLVAAFYVLIDALPDTSAADRWLHLLFVLVAAVGMVGVAQVVGCPVLDPLAPMAAQLGPLRRVLTRCHRAHAFYSIYMTLAGVLSLGLLAVLPRLLPGGGGAARGWIALWIAGGAGLALTFVRGAWVGFTAGALLLLGLVRRGRVLLLAVVAVLALVVVLIPDVRRRAESLVDPSDPTAVERLAMWRSALAMARDHPLTGVGPGEVRRVYPAYVAPEFRDRPRGHLHSTPLQVLIERGVLGLAAWLAIFATFFARAAGTLRRLAPAAARERALVAGSLAAVAGFVVGGLSEYNFGDAEVALVAWSVMAVPFVIERDQGESRGKP